MSSDQTESTQTASMDVRADADVRYANEGAATHDEMIRINALNAALALSSNWLMKDTPDDVVGHVLARADRIAAWIANGTEVSR